MSIKINTLLLLLFSSFTLFSQGYHIKDYDVKMIMDQDGSLYVTEDIVVIYDEKKQGIIRDIDYIYNWQGKQVKVKISNIQVPGYRNKVTTQGATKSIKIGTKGRYISGEHHYRITYTVKGHIAAYEDYLEFYWNPIPQDWDTRIEAYSYSLELPKPLDLQYEDYKVLSGNQGSRDNSATIQYANNTLTGRSTVPLNAKQGVTLAVKLPSDYVAADLIAESAQEIHSKRSKPFNNDPWTWILSVLGLVATWMGWKKIDGNDPSDKVISQQHYPPENMSAAQVGFFIDHKANARDVMSLIPQWGAEGLISLEKMEDDTKITKKGDLPIELPKYEHTLFDAIFIDGNEVHLNDLKYKIATGLYYAQTQLAKEQHKSDLYDQNSMMYLHSWRTILTGVVMIALAILSMFLLQSIVLCVTSILIGFALFIIYATEAKHSSTGIRIKNHLLGLEQFLKNHDGSDYPALMKKDPKYFDKMFPYAVALGIDTNFLERFGDHVEYAPPWYGYQGVNATGATMSSSMRNFSDNFDVKEISSVFSSVETSSGGSGGGFSGGGGSVGGGFGGGGGSSW